MRGNRSLRRHVVLLGVIALAMAFLPAVVAVADSHLAPDKCMGVDATIIGTTGKDKIKGTDGDDVISAGPGKDKIDGKGGNDLICGGDDDDHLKGGGGDDILKGEGGDDKLDGKDGDDSLYGGDGDDKLDGKKGDDHLDGGDGDDVLDGKQGDDVLDGGAGYDKLDGKQGDDTCANGEEYKHCETIGDPETDTVTGVGAVVFADGGPVEGAGIVIDAGEGDATGATGSDGTFSIDFEAMLPADARADVSYVSPDGVPVFTTTFAFPDVGDTVADFGTIVIPDPGSTALFEGPPGTFSSSDGSITVSNVPAGVASMFGAAYDIDTNPGAFPGLAGDAAGNAFNSTVFAWLVALDGSGGEVTDFSGDPLVVTVEIPDHQWGDLADLDPGMGNGIQVPMYSFDEGSGDWAGEPQGILVENPPFSVIPEADNAAILDGSRSLFDPVYVQFDASHLSWWNLDYKKTDFPNSDNPAARDFGDAPDPGFPSLLISNGARHIDPNRLWLGQWASLELDSKQVDADDYDDGLLGINPVSVRVNNWDVAGDIYVNILIDRNNDGIWETPAEWVVQNLIAPIPVFKGGSVDTGVAWNPVDLGGSDGWMRVTVTAMALGPNWDGTGEFAIGETEDWKSAPPNELEVWVEGDGTVTSAPAGIDCRRDRLFTPDCEELYPPTAFVTLTAVPDPGEVFLGWQSGFYGDCASFGLNPVCTLPMSSSRQARAQFTEPPPPDPSGVFSVAPGGPSGLDPAALYGPPDLPGGGPVVIETSTNLGLVAGDNIDAVAFGFSNIPEFWAGFDLPVDFSVETGNAGAAGTEVAAEAGCTPDEVAGDIYSVLFEFLGGEVPAATGMNVQRMDENGVACSTNRGADLGLAVGDDIDALESFGQGEGLLDGIEFFGPAGEVYFSLAPGSPTLATLSAGPADILSVVPGSGIPPVVYRTAASLSLAPGDDIDGLVLEVWASPPQVGLSLASGSPSLATNSWSEADVIGDVDGSGLAVLLPAADAGLGATDDLDALRAALFLFGFGGGAS